MNVSYRILVVFFLFISGCASPQHPSSLSAVYNVDCQKQKRIDQLQKAGVQVIEFGDELRLILPNPQFFVKNTPRLQANAYGRLDDVLALLNLRENYGINVLAYRPSLDDLKPNISLAQQQAQAIADYLSQRGLNTRLVTASAWRGCSARQREGTGGFCDDQPGLFSVEIRARILQSEDSQ